MESDSSGGSGGQGRPHSRNNVNVNNISPKNMISNSNQFQEDTFQLQHHDQNPMMNDLILKNLFEQLGSSSSTPGELNKARLVCRRWYKVALPVWLKHGSPIIIQTDDKDPDRGDDDEDDDFVMFLEQVHPNSTPSATSQPQDEGDDDIDNLVVGTGIKQYRKFHLEAESKYTLYPGRCFQLFWAACGRYLTHLTLKTFRIPDTLTFENILLCKYTPNLEHLVIDVHSIGMEDDSISLQSQSGAPVGVVENKKLHTLKVDVEQLHFIGFPVQWKSLLNHFPSLKHFGMGRYLSRGYTPVEDLLTAIKEIRNEDSTKLELKSFHWSFNQCFGCDGVELSPTSIPPLLRQVQLNLETFRFSFSEEVTSEEVHELLTIYAPTLKKLQIYREKCFDPCPFPEMPQLQTLEMSGYPVKDLSFLKELPNLRSLRICDEYMKPGKEVETLISATAVEPAAPAPILVPSGYPILSKFHCSYDMAWTGKDFTRLLELMPNLKDLGLHLSNTNFPLVCQYLPQLEHLRVYGDELGDDGILGIGGVNEEGEIVYSHPNIARLSRLKSFHMESGGALSANFSQNSVMHGFLSLPLLEKLVIMFYEMDPEVKKVVLERIPFAQVKVFLQYCSLCGPKSYY